MKRLQEDCDAHTALQSSFLRLVQRHKLTPFFSKNFCCHGKTHFANNSCSKNKNFSPLMPINCLVNRRVKETKSQKDKERKRLRVKKSKSQKVKELKRLRGKERKRQSDKKKKGERQKPRKPLEEYGGCAAAVMLPFWSYKSKFLTPDRQHPPYLLSEGCHSLQGDKQK